MDAQHDHQTAEIDPQAVQDAHALWANFTTMTRYGVMAVIALLALMAVFLVY